MEVLFLVEAHGMPLYKTASSEKEVTKRHYDAELALHRYNDIRLVEFTLKRVHHTTNLEEAQAIDLKIDKFRK